jgi:Cu+-exporting ATPase
MPEQRLLGMVGAAEQLSEHPLGRAIAHHMRSQQVEEQPISKVEALPGFGISGEWDGRQFLIGSSSLMKDREVSFGPALALAEEEMARGRTAVFAALDGQVVGVISLADRLRSDARELVTTLKTSMEQVLMLSGDSYKTAQGVADAVGLDSFEAGIKPHMKQIVVDSLRKAGMKVAMVGDGINDAPALVAADVGVALGSGTDVAVESADVVLVRSELSDVSRMFRLARISMKTIRQNLFWALFYNVTAIPIAAGVLYPVIGLTLTPAVAALAMSLSSVFVVSNSLRLSRVELS